MHNIECVSYQTRLLGINELSLQPKKLEKEKEKENRNMEGGANFPNVLGRPNRIGSAKKSLFQL